VNTSSIRLGFEVYREGLEKYGELVGAGTRGPKY